MSYYKEIGLFLLFVIIAMGLRYLLDDTTGSFLKPLQEMFQSESSTQSPTVTINDNTTLEVELADTPEKKTLGLGGRESLADTKGMLFPFAESDIQPPYFWMKGMLFPIDIIWIDEGKIIQIDKNAQPEPNVPDFQLKQYTPGVPVDYVLEVRGGLSDEKGIEVGNEFTASLQP